MQIIAVSRFLYLYYTKSNKLTAISIIPEIKPYIERWCSPYSLAAGSNSSNDINTIIPATDANIIPNTVSFIKGISISQPTNAPIGSASPEIKEFIDVETKFDKIQFIVRE